MTPTSAPAIGMGTWPDWLAAIGSILAFTAFSVAFIWEVRKRRHDDELRLLADQQAADERLSARASLARLVFARGFDNSSTQIRAKVINNSGGPIFDIDLSVLVPSRTTPPRPVMLSHKGPDVTELEAHDDGDVWLWFDDSEPPLVPDQEYFLQLDFTDANGLRWRRFENGQPEVLP